MKPSELPESLSQWVADAASAIEAPEKRDFEIEKLCKRIENYQTEMMGLPEEQQTRLILEKLGRVEDYHRALAEKAAVKAAKLKKQLRVLGIAALILAVVFAVDPIRTLLMVDVSDGAGMNWGAGQLFGGQLAAACLWLAVGIVLLFGSMKQSEN